MSWYPMSRNTKSLRVALRATSVLIASSVMLTSAAVTATSGDARDRIDGGTAAMASGNLVTTSVTNLDLKTLSASAFGDDEDLR